MKDFLLFRRMVAPALIQLLFWLGSLICIFVGLFGLFSHTVMFGLGVLIIGPLFIRVMCEYLIVQFGINSALQEIKQALVAKK
jgi:hypothetical protein